jgi:hypothetical protein
MTHRFQGDQKAWHKITLDVTLPQTFTETAATFRDHRLDVTFTNDETGRTLTVPGFFAADGNAADSGAASGKVWRVNFNPPEAGQWRFEAHFRTGDDIAARPFSEAPNAGRAMAFDGETGRFAVAPSDAPEGDFRTKGMIVQGEGTHYLQHQGDGDYFVRGGPGIPENFLANPEIDGTSAGRHGFETHRRDFDQGNPTWDGGKGDEIIGAVNYLAEQGQNAIYVMTNTAGGDGRDVWPWAGDFAAVGKNDRGISGGEAARYSTYDISKLAQWDIIFDHMDAKGIYKNVLLQETENDQLLNGGTDIEGPLSVERLIYLREMVARFGHNNGLQWNLGEENTNTDAERLAMADYMEALDPYGHLVVIHTYPGDIDRVFRPLLGDEAFDGTSFQTTAQNVRAKTIEYRDASAAAGDPWVLAWDEDSSNNSIIASGSNDPDSRNEQVLREAFWGHLMAGGTGGNWYLKQSGGHSFDQNYDTFRDHASIWQWTAAAIEFFNERIPFWEMTDRDGLTSDSDDFVMAKDGEHYVVYLPSGEARDVRLDLRGQGGETFDAFWYDPRRGGDLIPDGQVEGGAVRQVGGAPREGGKDWALLLRNADLAGDGAPPASPPEPTPVDGTAIYEMRGGRVVMQAEDGVPVVEGDVNNDRWQLTGRFDGDKGEGVMLWTGPDLFNGSNAGQPQTAPLTYAFTVDTPGTYHISLRAIRPETGEPSDRNNDFYVQIGDGAWKKVFFSGARETFQWGTTYDVGHTKSPSTFEVTQGMIDANGGVFELGVAGRSRQAGLDEIHIQKGGFSRDAGAATSPTLTNGPPPTPPSVEPPSAPDQDVKFRLKLYDAEDDTSLGRLRDGAIKTVTQEEAESLSIVARAKGADVASLRFELNGDQTQTDGLAPFALFGDADGDLRGGAIPLGENVLEVSALDDRGRVIDVDTFEFTLAQKGVASPPPPPPPVKLPVEPPASGPALVLELFDASDDSSLGLLQDDAVLSLAGTDVGDLSVVARVEGGTARTVRFELNDGPITSEGLAPFALFGDRGIDLTGGTIPLGENVLEVTAIDSRGKVLVTEVIDFTLVSGSVTPPPAPEPKPEPEPEGLLRLFLADADSDETLAEITGDGTLSRGDLAERDLTVYATAEGGDVGSVRFAADGAYGGIIENVSPYAAFGDVNGDFRAGWGLFEDGTADLRLIAYSEERGRGTVLEELNVRLVLADGDASGATFELF